MPAAFAFAWAEQTGNPLSNEELWNAILIIAMIVTIIWSIIECKLAGIWIGPLRFLLGASAGILGAAAVIILSGVILLVGIGGNSGQPYIYYYGEKRYLSKSGSNEYMDKYGNTFIQVDGLAAKVYDANGTYDVYTD